ncbi:MAG: DUF917 domain-containing protein [Crenarchaeota archaeon]|nr:DUF917 domain-containing protein [Thermoproteota archaeon]
MLKASHHQPPAPDPYVLVAALWKMSRQDILDLAVGAAILGAGGGGDPYIGMLMALQELDKGREIRVADPEEVPDDSFVVPVAGMGTPTVLIEKIPSGSELVYALKALEEYYNREADFLTPIEAGGINSTIPLVVAARRGLPVIDGDGMGRAFPELQMTTFHLYGIKATPMSMADEKGNRIVLDTIDNYWAEKIARVVTIKFGGTAWIAIYAMKGSDYKRAAVWRTMSLAIKIGRAIREAKERGKNPIDALTEASNGFLLFRGKIVDVKRFNVGGFARGEAVIDGMDSFSGSKMVIKFQNENLIALRDGEPVAMVPDIIVVVDQETARPITTERLRYGLRVAVIGIPCSEKWRTPEGLKVVGPKYFGYDYEYIPIEKLMGR